MVFLLGWFAIFSTAAGITWLANPILILSWILFRKKIKTSMFLSLAATVLSLSFLLFDSITATESGQQQQIISYKPGYWLWLTSCLIMFLGSGLLVSKK